MEDVASDHSYESETRSQFGITLHDIWRFFRRWILVFTIIPALFTILGIYIVVTATPRYTASALVAMERTPTDIGRFDTTGVFDASQVATQVALLSSELLARSVAKQLKLDQNGAEAVETAKSGTSFAPDKIWRRVIQAVRGLFGKQDVAGDSELIDADEARLRAIAEQLQSEVAITRVGYSYVLRIAYTSANRGAATRRANAYARTYIADKLERRERLAQRGAGWLEKKLHNVREEMNKATRAVQRFKARGDYRLQPGTASQNNDESSESVTTLEELEARARTYQSIFEGYLKTYTDTLQKQSFPFTNARVISIARGPAPKTYPRSKIIVLGLALIGCALALALAIILEGIYGNLFQRVMGRQ